LPAPATTSLYTPPLHDALPIFPHAAAAPPGASRGLRRIRSAGPPAVGSRVRHLQLVLRAAAAARRGRVVRARAHAAPLSAGIPEDRKSTRLNSSHVKISYAVFC